MITRHASRIDALRRTLLEDEADAILVSSETNVRYLTGFTGDSTILIVTKDRELAVSDFRYEEQLQIESPGLELFIRPVAQKLWSAVAEKVGLLGVRSVAFEANAMSVADQVGLRDALPTTGLIGLTGRVEQLRAIKDEAEIGSIRDAIRAAERAFRMLRDGLDPRETELQTADLLESYLKRCGSSKPPFDPIVAAGARSALPHATPSPDRRVGDDAFLLIDWGATVAGYRSDLTRMIVTGNVGEDFRKVYGVVLDAQERAIAAIRPGVTAKAVDVEARSAIERGGFGGRFGHGLGHGIGLAIHESPSLRPDSEEILQPGMVLTVEPGIYIPGWGGIRIEDDVLVTADGCEVLTSLPKSIDSLFRI
jgi:Xaa-Pro aminopeptidase